MKKSKFVIGLTAAMLCAVTLGSCASLVKSKDGVVLTVGSTQYTAEELFGDQRTSAAVEAKFSAVYKVAVRAYFKTNTEDNEEITNETKIKISEQKSTAQSNASTNGTSYDEEWNKILDSNGVDDEQGLYDKFEYELQKEKFENKLYDDNYDVLRDGGKFHKPGTTDTPAVSKEVPSYLKTKMPYHMKHILVKVGADANDNVTGTISSSEAIAISNVIKSLAGQKLSDEGEILTFDQISNLYSQDDTAQKAHSSLGIMSRDTSFVDDFKLGTYLYESFYGSSTTTTASKAFNLNNPSDSKAAEWAKLINGLTDPTNPTSGDNTAIGLIPYEAALALGKEAYADPNSSTNTKPGLAEWKFEDQKALEYAGIKASDLKDKYLPRNVIFNKYFNKHNIMVITPTQLPTYETSDIYNSSESGSTKYINKSGEGSKRSSKPDDYVLKYNSTYASYDGFSRRKKNNDEVNVTYEGSHHEVLRDDNGRTIFVFRSGSGEGEDGYQGIHFVVIERSPFIAVEQDDDDVKHTTTLQEYYTQYYPDQPGGRHPTYDDGGDKHTFANYVMLDTDIKNRKSRAETVQSELKKTDDNLNYYVYEYLLKDGNIVFTGERGKEIEKEITNWIKISRESKDESTAKSWDENWQKYYYSLATKHYERSEDKTAEDGSIVNGLIPECCVTALTKYTSSEQDAIKHLFGVGGVWHE